MDLEGMGQRIGLIAIWGAGHSRHAYVWLLKSSDCKEALLDNHDKSASVGELGIFLSEVDGLQWLRNQGYVRVDEMIWMQEKYGRVSYAGFAAVPLYSAYGSEHEKMETCQKLKDVFER